MLLNDRVKLFYIDSISKLVSFINIYKYSYIDLQFFDEKIILPLNYRPYALYPQYFENM